MPAMSEPKSRNLLAMIRASGLTVRQFAERLGVSAAAVYMWSDRSSAPQPSRIESMAEALGCTLDELQAVLSDPRPLGRPRKPRPEPVTNSPTPTRGS